MNHPRSGTSLFITHTHTHTYSGTPRGVPGIHTHTHSLNVVCPLVTPRGVPGEGLSLTHTHTVRFLVNHPRSGTSLSVHHMHTHSPFPGEPSQVRDFSVCSSHTHSPFPGEPSQVRDFSVCSSHAHTHTYSGTPRGVPGIHTHTHSLNVVCPLVTPRGVPGEGLSLTHTHTVRFLVNHPRSGTSLSVHHMHTHTHILWYSKRGAGDTHTYSLNVVCPLVTPRGVPGEGLSLTHTHTVHFLVNHPRSGTSLSVHHMHTHTHILWYPKRGAGDTHTYSLNVVCLLVNNPRSRLVCLFIIPYVSPVRKPVRQVCIWGCHHMSR